MASEDLQALGFSSDLIVYYVKSGWLTRLAKGIYLKPGSKLDLDSSLALLERFDHPGLHIGGRSALDYFGIRGQGSAKPATTLYCRSHAKLPSWISQSFDCSIKQKNLFDEDPDRLLFVEHKDHIKSPKISSPERATLELISDISDDKSMNDACSILKGAFSLRYSVIMELLNRCNNQKTSDLFLKISHDLQLPIFERIYEEMTAGLDMASLETTRNL